MAIARKPGSKPTEVQEAAVERFISGAVNSTPTSAAVSEVPGNGRRKPAMIRFDPELLGRVDRAAKRRGISRSAWVQYTLSKALDEEGV